MRIMEILSLCGLVSLYLACSGKKSANEPTVGIAKPVSITVLIEKPNSYVDSRLMVSGTLVNKGKDYFTDLQIVLEDSLGNTIPVTVWVPIEIPPMLDPSKPRPKVLHDYLNKEIQLKGFLRKGSIRQSSGYEYHLEVEEAEVLYEE
ncbi:hypothetical protein AYK25_08830 [Thermoplasmatales archaeon SM1-50]|nr:MAG: hypothetical protein AYK25_08830 [Thermoplasmatales archaeon SM1-50]